VVPVLALACALASRASAAKMKRVLQELNKGSEALQELIRIVKEDK
jgi:hypothetical protein